MRRNYTHIRNDNGVEDKGIPCFKGKGQFERVLRLALCGRFPYLLPEKTGCGKAVHCHAEMAKREAGAEYQPGEITNCQFETTLLRVSRLQNKGLQKGRKERQAQVHGGLPCFG